MGIFGAMTTAVSGLRSQAYALENISGNIANSQTTGFKRVETSFVDLLPDMPYRKELAGSVSAYSRLTNTIQGDLQSTGISTNMAINGEGFFIVQERSGYNNNRPTFGGVDLYTRRGDFTVDKDGFLVNGAGYYLRGSSIDPVSGELRGGGTGIVQISSDPLPARQTTQVQYSANLPNMPGTASRAAAPGVYGSELLSAPYITPPSSTLPVGYDPRVIGAPAGPGPAVVGSDVSRFMSQSIEGGLVPTYNAVGARIDISLRWAKVSSAVMPASVTGGSLAAGITTGGGGNVDINGTAIALPHGATRAAIIDAINAQTGTTNVTASVNGSNQIVLTHSNPASNVVIAAAPASTAATLTELGLTAGTTVGTATGTANVSNGLSPYILVNNTRIALNVGDNAAAILTKINAQAGTTGVTAQMDTSGRLVLNADDTSGTIALGGSVNALAELGLTAGSTASTPAADTWNLFYLEDSNATGNQPAWRNVGVPFTFNSSGVMTSPASRAATVPGLTVDGNAVGNITIDFSSGSGLTQYASADGRVEQSTLQQDGYSAGTLESISVTGDGRISGSYTNGRVVAVAQISVAQFSADNALKRRDGGVYEQTLESGLPIIGLNGATLIGGNVEGSNTDIAEEFSKMIVTQQAYSANTRVVSTSQQMLSDVLNMVR